MARTDIEKLVVQLSADIAGYKKALDRAQGQTNAAARGIEGRFRRMNANISKGLGGIGRGFAGGLLSAVSLVAVQRAISSTIKSVADLGDEAERAGVSAEALQALGFVARQNGVEVDSLTDALKKLNLEVGEAQTKGNDLGKIFAANKLTFSTDPVENFRRVAELIRNARTEQDKAVIGLAAFGKAYGDLIPLLNLGAEAIRKGEQAARDTGTVIDEELVNAAKEFDDAWTAVWDTWTAQSKSAILQALRGLQLITQHPGFFARRAAEDLSKIHPLTGPFGGLDFGSEEARLKAQMTADEAKLFDLTQRRLALEREIAKVREANLTGSPMFKQLEAELAAIIKRIEELNRELSRVGRQGSGTGAVGPFAPVAPATVVPSSLDGAVKSLEEAIKSFVDNVVKAESGGDRFAKNPLSSATGLGQFIESTWLRLFKENFPDRAQGLSNAAILALRSDAETSKTLIAAYARENAAVLQQAGVSVNEAALQLAHFLGPQGALKVLQAKPGTPIQGLLDQAAINANPQILGGGATVDDVIAYANARAGLTGRLRENAEAFDAVTGAAGRENAALGVEAQAMQMATFEAEKLRKEHELLAELRERGVVITPQIAAAVSDLASKYATEKAAIEGISQAQERAAQTAEQLAEAQRRAAEQASEMGREFEQAFAGAVKGFISDLVHGKSVTDALTNALQRLADQLLDIVLNNLLSGIFSGAFTGGVGGGGLFGGLFHQGAHAAGPGGPKRRVAPAAFLAAQRYHGGGFAGFKPGEIPAILERGEPIGPAAVDAAARRIIAIGGARGVGAGGSAAPQVNLTTKVVNRFDAGSFLSEALGSPAGEKAILNFVKARPAAFRSAIQA